MNLLDEARARRFKELVIAEDEIRAEFAAAETKFHANHKSNLAKQDLYIDPFTSFNDMIIKSIELKKIVDAAGEIGVEPHLLEFEAQCEEQIIKEI